MTIYGHNNATIEGFITHDATEKITKSGKYLIMFSLAINHYTKPGEPPRVSFIEVEAWDYRHFETLLKGIKVMVSGVLRQDRWEDERGKVVSRLKIIANEITFL